MRQQSQADRFKRWLVSLKVTRQKWRECFSALPDRDADPVVGFRPLPCLPALLVEVWDTWKTFSPPVKVKQDVATTLRPAATSLPPSGTRPADRFLVIAAANPALAVNPCLKSEKEANVTSIFEPTSSSRQIFPNPTNPNTALLTAHQQPALLPHPPACI